MKQSVCQITVHVLGVCFLACAAVGAAGAPSIDAQWRPSLDLATRRAWAGCLARRRGRGLPGAQAWAIVPGARFSREYRRPPDKLSLHARVGPGSMPSRAEPEVALASACTQRIIPGPAAAARAAFSASPFFAARRRTHGRRLSGRPDWKLGALLAGFAGFLPLASCLHPSSLHPGPLRARAIARPAAAGSGRCFLWCVLALRRVAAARPSNGCSALHAPPTASSFLLGARLPDHAWVKGFIWSGNDNR